ncbi:hypothetical protein GCM10010837_07370 [Aminobacter niigataensis]
MNERLLRKDDMKAAAIQGPLILISPDITDSAEPEYAVRANYAEAIAEAGGAPLILPCEIAFLETALAVADGILIAGANPGADVTDKRTEFEKALVQGTLARQIPLLGICHGMQLIGEHLGGHVVRDDPALLAEVTPHIPQAVPNAVAHEILIEPGSHLARLSEATRADVNSLHRHALADTGRFRVAARAPDGVVEAIEADGQGFCMGVQWHPEYRLTELDRRILAGFVGECSARARTVARGGVASRLAALGLALPDAPVPPGAFVGAVRHGNVVTVSGQVPLKDGTVMTTGRLGQDVSLEEGQDCARYALLNALAQLGKVAGGLERVAGFVRLAGYVAAAPDFTRHGAVIDGASELLRTLFPENWAHARVALGVSSLPRGVPVEIELSAVLKEGE